MMLDAISGQQAAPRRAAVGAMDRDDERQGFSQCLRAASSLSAGLLLWPDI